MWGLSAGRQPPGGAAGSSGSRSPSDPCGAKGGPPAASSANDSKRGLRMVSSIKPTSEGRNVRKKPACYAHIRLLLKTRGSDWTHQPPPPEGSLTSKRSLVHKS